jgi:acyl dehydratase
MTHYTYYWEDFREGETLDFGDKLVTKDEIIAFARAYDPQTFHLDEEAAKDSLLGMFCASGWHNVGMLRQMMCEAFLCKTAVIREVRWMKPVGKGYRLRVRRTNLSSQALPGDPRTGSVTFRFDVFNQDGLQVMQMTSTEFIARRNAAEAVR